MRSCGVSSSSPTNVGRVVGGQAGIPAFEERAQRPVERAGSRLQQQMGSTLGPLHLLAFGETLADHDVDGRFRDAGRDWLPGPVSLAVVGTGSEFGI